MCGISGILGDLPNTLLNKSSMAMVSELAHRGPDHQGNWVEAGIALASARLAIVDPTVVANQPMDLPGLKTKMVFNGEIYNYRELRTFLENAGVMFRTSSDTEVVQKSLELMGSDALKHFNGMWAIAFWDPIKRQLLISRDRYGKKPIYWTVVNGIFYFSSEMKSFKVIGCKLKPNQNYFSKYLHNEGVDSGEDTPFEGVHSIPAGHNLEIKMGGTPTITKWWDPSANLDQPQNLNEALEEFHTLFIDAVKIRIPTDSKISVSLSGGLDSTAVLGAVDYSLKSINSSQIIEPLTLTLPGSRFDESGIAARTAKQFGLKIHSVKMEEFDIEASIKEAIWHQESLAWSPALLAFHHYYRGVAMSGAKVILEGHGSDEYLAGYPSFIRSEMYRKIKQLKLGRANFLLKKLAQTSNPVIGERNTLPKIMPIASMIRPFLGETWRQHSNSRETEQVYSLNQGIFKKSLIETWDRKVGFNSNFSGVKGDLDKAVQYSMLPQILRVFDRASMANSVESRAPFMDYRLIQLIFSLSQEQLVEGLGSKPFVREGLRDFLTPEVQRNLTKQGFAGDAPAWFTHQSTKQKLKDIISKDVFHETPFINHRAYADLVETSFSRDLDSIEINAIWKAYSFIVWHQMFVL